MTGLILIQLLGHPSHAENILTAISKEPEFEHWVLEVPFPNPHRLYGRLAGDQMFRIYMDTVRSLRKDQYKASSLFFHTFDTALFCPHIVRRVPSVVSLDATPIQFKGLRGYHPPPNRPFTALEKLKGLILHYSRLKFRLTRDVLRSSRHVVTWSEWAKSSVVNDYGISPSKVTCIPPGVDTLRFAPAEREESQHLKIAFIGGDLERKGGNLLRRWMAEAGAQLGCELHLITRTEVASSPGVHVHRDITPNSDRLILLLRECDIFALPTTADCSPLALIEAMAAGLPVISSKIAGIPEIIRDGETGLLVKAGDYEELSAALRRLVLDRELRKRLGAAARDDALARFSLSNYERLLDCIVNHTAAKIPHRRRVAAHD